MPGSLTLLDVRPTLARVIGCCLGDARIAQYANEAVQRLLPRGKWRGTYARYRVFLSSGCITWPRQIETIEAFSICNWPRLIRSEWFEFLGEGAGLANGNSYCGDALLDRGEAIAFDDVFGTNKKLKVYADVPEDANAQLFVQYYDQNANWVRQSPTINGEYIPINAVAPQLSAHFCMNFGWVGVQKPVTNGIIRVYEYDTVTLAQKPLAIYEPDETRPIYRRSLVPGLSANVSSSSSDDSSGCTTGNSITVLAKLRFIPVRDDTDYLLIGNLPAIKDQVQAILKRERNLFEEAMQYEASAVNELQQELKSYQGSGMTPEIRVQDSAIFGGGGCGNLVGTCWPGAR